MCYLTLFLIIPFITKTNPFRVNILLFTFHPSNPFNILLIHVILCQTKQNNILCYRNFAAHGRLVKHSHILEMNEYC